MTAQGWGTSVESDPTAAGMRSANTGGGQPGSAAEGPSHRLDQDMTENSWDWTLSALSRSRISPTLRTWSLDGAETNSRHAPRAR